jgi:hypothetical protein
LLFVFIFVERIHSCESGDGSTKKEGGTKKEKERNKW